MKVIGETKIGEGYAKKDALVCIISIDELKKVADKAGYRTEFDPPAIGSDYPIDQGFDFRSQLSDSIRLMREAYEKFSKVAPVAAEFAGLVAKHEHGGWIVSRGINKVILVGNLGADPETRYTANGGAITNIRLATSESWRDKQTGEQQERTEWHRVVLFGKLGEIAGEYLKKGRQVYIEGSLRTNKYTDREGVERYTTDIVANEMQMLGGGGERGGVSDGGAPRGGRYSESAGRGGGTRSSAPPARSQSARQPPPSDFEDDDIPF